MNYKRVYNRTIAFAFVAALLGFTNASAQKLWTLKDCIEYGMENSLDVRSKIIELKHQEIKTEQAKLNRTGNLNSSIEGGMGFGMTKTETNLYIRANSFNSNAGINYSIPLFNWFRLKHIQDMEAINFQASAEELNSLQDAIALQVAVGYLDILYSKELVKLATAQLEVAREEMQKIRLSYNAGAASKDQILESQSQVAREESNLTNAETQLSMNSLKLAQLLNVDDVAQFEIETPKLQEITADISLISASDLYTSTVDNRPSVKAAKQRLAASEIQFKAIKATLYPSVNLGAGFNTSYVNLKDYHPPLGQQFTKNSRENIGVSISIPIYNGLQARNNIKSAALGIDNMQNEVDKTRKNFRETIEKSYNDALSSHKKYLASKKVAEATAESFLFAKEKLALGAINVIDFNISKNNLILAEIEVVQAKYNFIFATKVLDYYRGIELSL